MADVPFGEWAPDTATVDTAVLTIARNVLAIGTGYGPVPALTRYGSVAALPADCKGVGVARTSTGGWAVYAGTATALYKLIDDAWEDATGTSGPYAVPSGEFWQFAQWRDQLVAVNIADPPQVIDVNAGTGTNFADLSGTPPQARYAWVAGEFLFLGALSTDQSAVQNSAVSDITGWTAGTDLSAVNTFPKFGRVMGGGGGEYGYVVQEQGIRRVIFQPGQDVAHRFEEIEDAVGAAGGYSCVFIGSACFYYAEQGFYKISEGGIEPIGSEKIDEWFTDNVDDGSIFSVLGFLHPTKPYIMWAFTNAATTDYFERVLAYNWKRNRWTYFETEAQFWAPLATAGVTVEGLDSLYSDLESIPYSLDSRIFEGGRPICAAIDKGGFLAFLEGSVPLEATLTTSLMRHNPGARAYAGKAILVGEPMETTYRMRVGTRNKPSDTTRWRAPVEATTVRGVLPIAADGAYHQYELTLTHEVQGDQWRRVTGLEVAVEESGDL